MRGALDSPHGVMPPHPSIRLHAATHGAKHVPNRLDLERVVHLDTRHGGTCEGLGHGAYTTPSVVVQQLQGHTTPRGGRTGADVVGGVDAPNP